MVCICFWQKINSFIALERSRLIKDQALQKKSNLNKTIFFPDYFSHLLILLLLIICLFFFLSVSVPLLMIRFVVTYYYYYYYWLIMCSQPSFEALWKRSIGLHPLLYLFERREIFWIPFPLDFHHQFRSNTHTQQTLN